MALQYARRHARLRAVKRRDKFQPVDERGEYLTGTALYKLVREIAGDTLVLAFSRGKDSIAMWLELRDYFNIIPYYGYMIPGGLSYERESLDYYEDFFGTKIHRFPHPIFWKNVNDLVFQPPERVSTIRTIDFPDYDYSTLVDVVASIHGLDKPYVAFGYRAADSPRRRLLVLREGPLGSNLRYFWPIWDWTIDMIEKRLKGAGVQLALDYELWGRTLTAIDYQYAAPIRDNLPDDWEKVKFWYPLIEAEVFRHEVVGR